MENKITDNINRSFELPLPDGATMDEQLDKIIPKIKPWGEDLYEQEFYLETRWIEVRDDDQFHESVLHIFRPENEYLISIDGNITQGIWKILTKSNTFIIDKTVEGAVITSELYDLAFLNKDFFILRKHGDQIRKGGKKYFVLAREQAVRGLEWREVMDLLYNQYRNNSNFIVVLVILIAMVLGLFGYSLFAK